MAGSPIASNAASTPPPVSSSTVATGSVSAALTVSVAPNVRASVSFSRVEVDGDDPLGARQPGALHDVEPDPAAADDGDRLAGSHPRPVERRADPGDDGAAEQRAEVERQLIGHLHEAVAMGQHLLGEAAQSRTSA